MPAGVRRAYGELDRTQVVTALHKLARRVGVHHVKMRDLPPNSASTRPPCTPPCLESKPLWTCSPSPCWPSSRYQRLVRGTSGSSSCTVPHAKRSSPFP